MSKTLLGFTLMLMCTACWGADFKDVPKAHWAAESVKVLADAGVVKGYPDSTFKGDKPVTRYELAVALDGMIRFIKASFEPVKKAQATQKPKGEAPNPMAGLKAGGYLPPDSPLLKDPNKPVTAEQLAAALASVSAKLIEERVPSDQASR
jgi:hypothetical protein